VLNGNRRRIAPRSTRQARRDGVGSDRRHSGCSLFNIGQLLANPAWKPPELLSRGAAGNASISMSGAHWLDESRWGMTVLGRGSPPSIHNVLSGATGFLAELFPYT